MSQTDSTSLPGRPAETPAAIPTAARQGRWAVLYFAIALAWLALLCGCRTAAGQGVCGPEWGQWRAGECVGPYCPIPQTRVIAQPQTRPLVPVRRSPTTSTENNVQAEASGRADHGQGRGCCCNCGDLRLQVARLTAAIKALEQRQAAPGPAGPAGEPGQQGRDGQPGKSPDVKDVAAELLPVVLDVMAADSRFKRVETVRQIERCELTDAQIKTIAEQVRRQIAGEIYYEFTPE